MLKTECSNSGLSDLLHPSFLRNAIMCMPMDDKTYQQSHVRSLNKTSLMFSFSDLIAKSSWKNTHLCNRCRSY